ncbi:type I glyceraldehyde-3-phosphate dehydrogenase [Candidatus Nomurabacteria bacterium]|uniref:Glyceraldehyde-3-phosphate dehydrogenase n=1 Tax=candidate division WWE3 bacterium TaxID=2053526 RepID=A0A955IWB7_UNCKA|nr:type I glyceraldehyde-3-phosphate dehydrogenase [candidate division WWE3 bacterium]MCB9823440.1 type I glyceraldehyde-3-phosphate dehydrogenase [Candidatus Nomurabacteria bacterium]MCB9827722.1 type I glyceraldehyde-3-phosphate dehydrogenase [Candidatus Nomurabacteria bacterium]HXK52668.1 type I glyceraldehyde-3-phosphate dehydrogenase [bacterium]
MIKATAQPNKKTRIAINGFGRIGRAALKIALSKPEAEVVAINDLSDPEALAYYLKHDSAYKNTELDISILHESDRNYMVIGSSKVAMFAEADPKNLPWKNLNVDVVLECTGFFTKDGSASAHLDAGATKVVISAPAKGGNIQTFLLGVNDKQYLGQNIVSNASCTTNCISPIVSIINKEMGIVKSIMTTVHAVTSTQNIVDSMPKKGSSDLRKGRAGFTNMIPTTTGAAIATTEVLPELKGLFDGVSIRVPVITGSLADITMLVRKKTTVEEINSVLEKAASTEGLKGVLKVTHEQLVSSDIIGDPHSAIVDASMTKVVDGDLVKVLAWYDNEWGYSNRLVELALTIAQV